MQLEMDSRKTAFTLSAKSYSLAYNSREPGFVRLKSGKLSQKLCIWSACDAPDQKDVLTRIIKTPRFEKIKSGQKIYFEATSRLHGKQKFVFDCFEDRLEYYLELKCKSPIDKIHYLQGWGVKDLLLPRNKRKKVKKDAEALEFVEIKSSKAFDWLFNPEPNGLDRQWVSSQEYAKISVNNDPHFNGSNWFFTPGLLAFAAADRKRSIWMSLGLAARPGEYNFSDYEFASGRFMGLSLTYFGQTIPGGPFKTPRLVMHFAPTEKEVLEKYVNFLLKSRLVKKSRRKKADWWKEPIFCGWGQQCYESDFHNKIGEKDAPLEWNPHQYANQAFYENMIDQLDSYGLPVKSVILDDKWQKTRGLPEADEGKWPRMREFIDKMHEKGKKVILWWGLFTGEGVPDELCVTKGGEKLHEDPTNPEFVKKLRACVKKMLSSQKGCYDADGFKIDFTANITSDPDAVRHGKPWGIEMLRVYIEEIYKAAKRAKKDAFIITHAANPYFLDVCDCIRLNDICEHYQDDIVKKMEFRAEMSALACPGLLIDTDNWPCPTQQSWLEYMKVQPELGVPSLYYSTHIDCSREKIDASAWKQVAGFWKDYVKNL